MGLRDDILGCLDRQPREVEVPEWQCKVWLANWDAFQREEFQSSIALPYRKNEIALPEMYARSLVLGIVDEAGKPVFGPEDADALKRKNAAVLDRLLTALLQHNGMMPDSVASAKNG